MKKGGNAVGATRKQPLGRASFRSVGCWLPRVKAGTPGLPPPLTLASVGRAPHPLMLVRCPHEARIAAFLSEGLELESEDRAEFAERLLSTLEPEDADVAEAWRVEIRKRIAELRSLCTTT